MLIKREQWNYGKGEKVREARYKNSQNKPHWHYDCELVHVDKGLIEIECDETTYLMHAGEDFFIDSEKPHCMHAKSQDTEISILIFTYDLITQFANGTTLKSPVLSKDYGVMDCYNKVKDELKEKYEYYEFRSQSYVSMLMSKIFRNEERIARKKNTTRISEFKDLLADMEQNPDKYDLDCAAKFMCMNPSYFSRMFRNLTGVTFTNHLNHLKCAKAVEMLKSDEKPPITSVSIRCGFGTIRNFNRMFKSMTGYSPTELPHDFVMPPSFSTLTESAQNPTDASAVALPT